MFSCVVIPGICCRYFDEADRKYGESFQSRVSRRHFHLTVNQTCFFGLWVSILFPIKNTIEKFFIHIKWFFSSHFPSDIDDAVRSLMLDHSDIKTTLQLIVCFLNYLIFLFIIASNLVFFTVYYVYICEVQEL